MEEISKSASFAVDILIGLGFGLFIAVAIIFVRHNLLIAIAISIIYSLIQLRSYWNLFKEQKYVGMFGRFVLLSIFICALASFVWGILFNGFDIGFVDQTIFIALILISFLLTTTYAILKNFFPESIIYKQIEQTFAGLSAIGVLNKE